MAKSDITKRPKKKAGDVAHASVKAGLSFLPPAAELFSFVVTPSLEKRRFDLLRQAYVGARYHDDYVITPQELKYLARCIELLKEQTETSCEKKMEKP